MAHTVSFLKNAIATYEDLDNPTDGQLARLEELRTELAKVRERNKAKRSPADREAARQRKIEAVQRKIDKKNHAIEYFTNIRHTNPEYFSKLIADLEFDVRVLLNQRRGL